MEKLKLFIYPTAKPHVHDNEHMHLINGVSQYVNTVPMSKKGISDYFELVNPDEADYFYMGQISDGMNIPNPINFKYLYGNERKHICDIEGDWLGREIPNWLKKCTLTINGAKDIYKGLNIFIRPTFSFLLIDLAKNNQPYPIRNIENISFGFRGFPDPHGIRNKMKLAFDKSNLPGTVILNNRWMAQNTLESHDTQEYINLMKNNIFSLCPAGAGVDSIRFYESCYFGSIPIIISNNFVPFEYEFSDKFYFRIDPSLSMEEINNELLEISKTDIDILKKMSYSCQVYFNTQVVDYFKDPTYKFIKWLSQNE
jgi:hypothetical protein